MGRVFDYPYANNARRGTTVPRCWRAVDAKQPLRAELSFVRLRGEAQRIRHTDEAVRRSHLRFPARREIRINVADLLIGPHRLLRFDC